MESCVPPGFRFHPTEEELVGYYLKRKVSALAIDLDVIIDIDLYKMEPWDIQGRCKLGYQEQTEWYFFSHKDRKYPTGTRTNRATTAGFWKATGRDKPVVSKDSIIGMRKTLVFYKGRAPNGRKSDWIMHEYRLQTSEHGPPQEEGWVVCRAFKKPVPSQKPGFDSWSNPYNIRNSYRPPSYFSNLNNNAAMPSFDPDLIQGTSFHHQQQLPLPQGTLNSTHSPLLDPPNLDSPSNVSASFVTNDSTKFEHSAGMAAIDDLEHEKGSFGNQELSDWKSFDKLIGQSSYAYTNMALVPYNGELDNNGDENHLSQVLDCCFPDL